MARKAPKEAPVVPIEGVDTQLKGTGLMSSAGRGVKNGIPYGEQLQTEQQQVEKMHRFDGKAGRLRAATRRALGR